MILYGLMFALLPIAIVAAIFVPMFNPAPNIDDSQSTEKLEQVIKEDS